ncbi:MAG: response regulator [Acidobacteria bacterium]|nr:response regulator [Acidobacteriota bacterium]
MVPKILLVEDDSDIQKLVRISLKFRGVQEVVVAEDGEKCLSVVGDVQPDVILLDVMLPRMNGYEICRRLKSNPKTKDIPVIFLSARAMDVEVKKGLQVGARGYLVKPFNPMTLFEEITLVLSGQRAPQL